MPIIEVNHVTKEYRLGHMKSLKQTALNTFSRLRGKPSAKQEPFKALDDINFKVEEGEVLGIIGTNGAGKSTLLKLLARVSVPTKGKIKVQGSVAPLIEVGAGLIGDLTGRENIYLNGSILGLSIASIKKKFDEIVEFAELEEFIDTPIKRYSSGMKVRLGFAIATSVDADILIIDEVLAVGDLAFQRKCFDRMEDLIKGQGKTVLLVSHNIRQVDRLCSRVILVGKGRLQMDADPQSVCNAFYDTSNEKILKQHKRVTVDSSADSSGEIEVDRILLYPDDSEEPVNEIGMHSPMTVELHLTANMDLHNLEIVLGFHTTDFVYIFSATSTQVASPLAMCKGKHSVACRFDDMMLTPGVYSLRLAIRHRRGDMIWYGENLLSFKVMLGKQNIATIPKLGLLDVPYRWDFSAVKRRQQSAAIR